MKSLPFKNGLFIVMVFALLLTSCNSGTQIQNQNTPYTDTGSQEETQAMQNTDENADTSFAQLTLLDTKIQLDGNTLSYGKLQITLPDGVTVEQQEPDGGTVVIDLVGAESAREKEGFYRSKPFPPRIWLANYHVEYDDIMELISALLDLLPGVSIREQYISGEEHCYLYTYNEYTFTTDKKGYLLIYEDDVYIVEEISAESYYGFGALLDDKAVQWKDRTCALEDGNSYEKQLYSKCNVESDMTFLVLQTAIADKMRVLILYRDGYFSSIYQNIVYEEWRKEPSFKDCNFDGYPDIVVSDTRIYLWNTEQKKYEATQIPEDFSEYSWYTRFFPETETIWRYDFDYVRDVEGTTSWDDGDYTEILWKWEGAALVKQRECIAEVRGKDVRISAYEGSLSNILFDKTFTREDWEQNRMEVQKLYRQFYAGMVLEENDGRLHTIDYDQESEEYIPQALLDIITKAMLDGVELETMEELANDRELTRDEVSAIAKDNLAMRCDLVEAEVCAGNYIMVMADADNDGIMDIVAEEYFGGTAGFTEYVFYKGQEDGTYQKTSSYDAVQEEFAIISYDGKNYLCRTLYDHNKKIYSGFGIACYVDGVQVQTADLTLFPEEYDIRLAECAGEEYRAFAENIFENSLHFKEMIDEYKNIDGISEESSLMEEYEYQCDLDNDGEAEQYNKSIWLPSNMLSEHLYFYGDGKGIEHTNDALDTVEGTPIMMWVEPFAEKNIINVISLTGLHDFEITGFLLNGAEYTSIYRITAEVTYGVSKEISTQMHRVNM
ncbi:MAG: hypothetical protein K2N89_08600 [Lachnospiraceae bacterium]|nr:hypothetical protein [Lachnospiraceae bacterium]